MKKEINALLKAENATLKLNKFCTLHRWQKDALGNDVDGLTVSFSIVSSFHDITDIKSRDWRGIVSEVSSIQAVVFAAVSDRLNSQLLNGYIG